MARSGPWQRSVAVAALSTVAIWLGGCDGNDSAAPVASSALPSGSQPTMPPAGTASTAGAAPALSGSAASKVTVGQPYQFQPAASDPAGRMLSFSIQNRPKWAAFDTSTGELSGTPTAGDSGTDANIVISVNDGAASAALAPFAIQVTPASAHGLTLAWVAPTGNTDGEAIRNLAGYRIHYGTSPTQLNNTIDINNAGVLSYTLANLASGTWYFAVAAVNAENVESNLSSIGKSTL
ncbi:MAG TPA: putative Ig domain-containing protein [Steroidobacteraceae bacterium]